MEQKDPLAGTIQDTMLKYDPVTGDPLQYEMKAEEYRMRHPNALWVYNPWAGNKRHAGDADSDNYGVAIVF